MNKTKILAIDPGTTESAWLLLVDGIPRLFAKEANAVVRSLCWLPPEPVDLIAIEMVASYGMPVGREVFETVRWIGRFQDAAERLSAGGGVPTTLVYRQEVKLHHCRSSRANDASIRQAILDRFGGKDLAIGRKKTPGPLYGITGDCWSALAIGLYVNDCRATDALGSTNCAEASRRGGSTTGGLESAR